jgi:hypothetical protein
MKTIQKPVAIVTSSLLILISALILVLMLSSCSFERIEGNYNVIDEDRQAQPFDELISSGSFRVYLTPDSVTSIQVTAESNILPYLYTISDGTTLRIGFKNGYNIRENFPVAVYLHSPHINTIHMQGSGILECKGFTEDRVELDLSGSGSIEGDFVANTMNADISGSGTITLTGIAKTTDLSISGSGNIRSLELSQTTCVSSISGSGDIYTNVRDHLQASISGSGCVYYQGDPEVDSHVSGSGKVKKY